MIIDFEIDRTLTINQSFDLEDELDALESSTDDRTLILVSAIIIENQIEVLLKILFPEYKNLTDNNSKELTFSLKTNLLKSFQLCDNDLFVKINVIRKIRNRFAHDLSFRELELIDSGTKSNINQMFQELETGFTITDVRRQVEFIVKNLAWEVYHLAPYANKLRQIVECEETKVKLRKA
ncbi:MAG: hypothetical protein N4A35_16980 [Flavobacteriales bacterium]|jgi:hypothetical protein|nr:hypothetical protein [Flavobacteriales bacterium]